MGMQVFAWLAGVLRGQGSRVLEDLGVQELCSIADLDAAFAARGEAPFFLFKHSTACPVSASAYQRVAAYLESSGETPPPFYLVKVIESRPVSNEIAARLGVTHQSPQLILVRGAQAAWNASHGGIDAAAIQRALG